MDQRVKKKWLEALRSGKYPQGRSVLRNTGEQFCCLGVLCELAVEAGVATVERPRDENAYVYSSAGDRQCGVLPAGVSAWAGLNAGNPLVSIKEGPDNLRTLSALNDGGTTFGQIANYIEGQL